MSKTSVSRNEKREMAVAGHGVIIDKEKGFIYRLCVAPDGRYRVALNKFDVTENTVLGPAVQTWDYKTPGEAIDLFEQIQVIPGMVWREDERVFYDPNG